METAIPKTIKPITGILMFPPLSEPGIMTGSRSKMAAHPIGAGLLADQEADKSWRATEVNMPGQPAESNFGVADHLRVGPVTK
jgi:hypothetical protein